MGLVHNVVSVALDKLTEADRRGRAGNEEKMKEQEELKNGITTVVGAALGEQECWEKTACKAGEYAASLPGKDVLFIVLDRLVPSSWVETLDSVKQVNFDQNLPYIFLRDTLYYNNWTPYIIIIIMRHPA